MPRRSRDNQGKLLPKTPTLSNYKPSIFFDGCEIPSPTKGELQYPLDEQPAIFEEPFGEEEKTNSPTQTIVENRDNEVNPIREINGEEKMKNISPTSLPHFHDLNLRFLIPSYLNFLLSIGPMTMALMRKN